MRALRPDTRQSGFSLPELLVVIAILGIVSTAITSVILSTQRAEQFQRGLQEVIDDGRLSLSRIRRELRGARRVLATSCAMGQTIGSATCEPSDRLHFWVDQNQDAIPQAEELICYAVVAVPGSTDRWRVMRWTHAMLPADPPDDECSAAAMPAAAQVLAETLVDPRPFTFDRIPQADPHAAPTRSVDVLLELEVAGTRGPDSIDVRGTIRIRNVA